MKKSSLKTFLAGKNPYEDSDARRGLAGSHALISVVGYDECGPNSNQYLGDPRPWYCDVLDDGTAITYYPGD